jgi:antitoxin FitA
MATLYVRDVPDDLYERLRREARAARRSISAEAVEILRRALPSPGGVSLDDFLETADQMRARHRLAPGAPTAAELVREDRDR